MKIHYEENVDLIPKDAELVVYTPAVPKEHKELVYYQQNGYKVVKRSDVLQIATESSFNICIAGTHGKTTITTHGGTSACDTLVMVVMHFSVVSR